MNLTQYTDKFFLILSLAVFLFISCDAPQENIYSVKKLKLNQIKVDAKKSNDEWRLIEPIQSFQNHWDDAELPFTSVSIASDQKRLYFLFELTETSHIYRDMEDQIESIALSDRVEVFFAQDKSLERYYGLEMDLWGRYFSFSGSHYRKLNKKWKWPGKNEIKIKAKTLDQNSIVELSVSLKTLRQLGLLHEDGTMLIGLFRADFYRPEILSAVRWISWQDPQTKEPDFHVPEAFAKIKLEK